MRVIKNECYQWVSLMLSRSRPHFTNEIWHQSILTTVSQIRSQKTLFNIFRKLHCPACRTVQQKDSEFIPRMNGTFSRKTSRSNETLVFCECFCNCWAKLALVMKLALVSQWNKISRNDTPMTFVNMTLQNVKMVKCIKLCEIFYINVFRILENFLGFIHQQWWSNRSNIHNQKTEIASWWFIKLQNLQLTDSQNSLP